MAAQLWYFAYGSNMSTEKFTGSRGILPLTKVAVSVPGWQLAFSIPGMPYSEPSFTAIEPRDSEANPEVQGVIYLITKSQFVKVIASEGGATAYGTARVDTVPLAKQDQEKYGLQMGAVSLVATMQRKPEGRPSRRYMDLLLSGAAEARLPEKYRLYLAEHPTYQDPSNRWSLVGAKIFICVFTPLMAAIERLTKATIREDGHAPTWVVIIVRMVVFTLWFVHDMAFAPIFGRGDGLGVTSKGFVMRSLD